MRAGRIALLALLLTAAHCVAQTPAAMPEWQKAAGGRLEFEVASVRMAQTDSYKWTNVDLDASDYFRYTGGPVRASGWLISFICFAYKIEDASEGLALNKLLPKWTQGSAFSVEARAPMEKPTKDQIRLMMQSLLAERFGLRLHTEMKTEPVYALVLTAPGKPGLQRHPEEDKLCAEPWAEHPHAEGDPVQPSCSVIYFTTGDRRYRLRMMDYTMAEIAGNLAASPSVRYGGLDNRPVADQTGLTGHFDLSVEFVLPPKPGTETSEASEPGSLFLEALKRQAGLELRPVNAPVLTYVVDAVEPPTPN